MPRIKIWGDSHGNPTEFDDQYVVEYDPTREGVSPSGVPMNAHLITTPDPAQAKVYATAAEAFEEWRRAHGVRPWDGKPNRPLTAFNVEIS